MDVLKKIPDETINMIITSPPYADQIKDYGEKVRKVKSDKFVEWFIPRAKEFYRVLTPDGSFVLNISDKLEGKYQSLYVFRLVIALCDQVGFHLVRDYIWHNPATPPSSLYYLSNDWPKIVCKFNIVFWGEKRKEPVSRFFSKTFHFVYTRYLRFLFPVLSDPRISS